MASRVILIGASVRSAAESATRAGIAVIGIDQFGDADTRAACQHWLPFPTNGNLNETLRPFPDIPVVPVGGFEAFFSQLENVPNPIAAPSADIVRHVRDPAFLRQLAHHTGIRFPACSPPTAPVIPGQRWLLKNRFGAAGLTVREIDYPAAAANPDQYYQKFQSGKPYGVCYLSIGGQARLLGVCRSLVHRQPGRRFLYAGSIGPLHISSHHRDQLLDLGRLLIKQTGLTGLFNIDILHHPASGELWLLEINPRYSASMELLEPNGESLIALHLQAFCGEPAAGQRELDIEAASIGQSQFKRVIWTRDQSIWQPEPVTRWAAERHWTVHDRPAVAGQAIPAGTPAYTLKGSFASWTVRRTGKICPSYV